MTLCSEEDVGTPTSSSETLLGQIFVKTCGEDNVSMPTSSSAILPGIIICNLWPESQGPKVGRWNGPHNRPGSSFCEPAEALYSAGDLTMTSGVGMPERVGLDEKSKTSDGKMTSKKVLQNLKIVLVLLSDIAGMINIEQQCPTKQHYNKRRS